MCFTAGTPYREYYLADPPPKKSKDNDKNKDKDKRFVAVDDKTVFYPVS